MSPRPLALKILDIASVLLFLAALGVALLYAPLEAVMGAVQKVFYFHIANAWIAMLGFIAAGVAGVAYLVTRNMKWDIVELSAVEISLVFFSVTIVLGSIWAYPVWNTWWTWDPRLTTAAILELIYLAYLMLRQGIEDPERRARFGAVYTLVGAVSVPITFFAIRIFRTIHPVIIGGNNAGAQATFAMTPHMLQTMFFCLFAFSIIFVTLLWHRIRLAQMQRRVEELQLQLSD
jgi:heme exporter protein C